MVHSAIESGSRPGLTRRASYWQFLAPLSLLLCSAALAQSVADAQRPAPSEWYRHIRAIDPSGRPGGPLRQENINDEEVREVQRAALQVYPDSIVNISGVTEGCNCEEGSACTAQVWLALYREEITRGLVLSKVEGHWKVGAVQRWWLQYSEHQAKNPGFERSVKQIAWAQENQRLLDTFPACPVAAASWTPLRSEIHDSMYVDMSSIQVSGFIRRVNFKRVVPPRPNKYPWPSMLFSVSLVAFDCKDHRMRVDWIDSYYDDGSAHMYPGYTDSVLWDPIRPQTVSAADWDLVCGWNHQ